jgi:hypothetical protein
MNANSGYPWSEMDIADLTHSLAYGNPVADAASMLCRDEDEVRQKAKELRLVERPAARRPLGPSPHREQQRDDDHEGECGSESSFRQGVMLEKLIDVL